MIKITRKAEASFKKALVAQVAAIVAALAAAGLIMAIIGYNPLEVYSQIIAGALGSAYRVRASFNKIIPLVILSLGVAVAFKMTFWNIGAEGQMAMGGFGAAYVALHYGHLSPWILLPAMMAAGVFCGAVWALIPALLKTKFNTSETLVTLMMNYIALKWITYLQYGPWKEGGFPKIPTFTANAVLPSVLGIHSGWIIALALTAGVHILLTKAKLGYEIAVIGESPTTARYSGIAVTRVIVIAMALSGALCGMAGMIQSSAVEKTLSEGFTAGLGFTAVITTWLARLSAPGIVLTSFIFGMLLQGGSFLEISLRISADMAKMLQAIIIFFVLGSEFFLNYRVRFGAGDKGAAAAAAVSAAAEPTAPAAAGGKEAR
ncbi:MAG: ABC transporter permease [Peptococcaceae bacterium]|nr:ABC transporter permease [Peptococcaceae bacterium]